MRGLDRREMVSAFLRDQTQEVEKGEGGSNTCPTTPPRSRGGATCLLVGVDVQSSICTYMRNVPEGRQRKCFLFRGTGDFLGNTELFTKNEEDLTRLLLNQTSCFPSVRRRVQSEEKYISRQREERRPTARFIRSKEGRRGRSGMEGQQGVMM